VRSRSAVAFVVARWSRSIGESEVGGATVPAGAGDEGGDEGAAGGVLPAVPVLFVDGSFGVTAAVDGSTRTGGADGTGAGGFDTLDPPADDPARMGSSVGHISSSSRFTGFTVAGVDAITFFEVDASCVGFGTAAPDFASAAAEASPEPEFAWLVPDFVVLDAAFGALGASVGGALARSGSGTAGTDGNGESALA
jgi:hypothetical protein